MIGLFVLVILTLCLVSITYYTFKLGISPMPTSKKCQKALFSLLPERVEGPIYELGSGWGHLAFPLAKRYPSQPVVAYELSFVPYLMSKVRQKIFGPENLTFLRKDFLKEDLSQASLIVVYLYPGGMKELESRLPPQAIILSNTFRLPHRTPIEVKKVDDLYQSVIYLYHEKK